MKRDEAYRDIQEYLNRVLYPRSPCASDRQELPDYIIYDRACHYILSFRDGNLLGQYAQRWFWDHEGPKWRVDRFHFLSHSAEDENCRLAIPPQACVLGLFLS
jgi:hypothetical protein